MNYNEKFRKRKKLLAERRKVIFHPYGEKSPVIRLLSNVGCGFPSPTKSIVPNFIFIVLIVFGWPDPKKWVFPLTWEVTFTTARAIPSSAVIKVQNKCRFFKLVIKNFTWQRVADFQVQAWFVVTIQSLILSFFVLLPPGMGWGA